MNRAAKLHSVLRDGNPHSRRDIFERVGFMLTNNAASELRAEGFNVVHEVVSMRGERVDFYQLVEGGSGLGGEPAAPPLNQLVGEGGVDSPALVASSSAALSSESWTNSAPDVQIVPETPSDGEHHANQDSLQLDIFGGAIAA